MKFLNEIDGASKVIQDANNRFVTDSEKSTWNGKQNAITGGASTITSSNLTTNRALVSDSSGKVTVSSVTSTELGYVSGVTSSIQTQLNGKASTSHSHAISDVSGLQTALDGKSASSHNHTLDGLSNTTITSNTNGEILRWNGTKWVNNTLAEAGIAPSSHTHTRSQITDLGTIASINTNASTSNYLRGDGTWVTPPNTTYSAGNGLSLSGTTFSVAGGNGLVQETSGLAMGTPSTLTTSTTNSVTETSHTHAVTFPVTSVNGKTGAVSLTSTDIQDNPDRRFVSGAEVTSWNNKSEIPLVIGTQTVTTASWTGVADTVSELYNGLTIRYWLPRTSASNVTLNLTLKDGSSTGAINCYYGGATRLTTHYGAGSFIMMIYLENALVNGVAYTGWWAKADYVDGTESYTVRWNTSVKAGTAITRYKLLVQGADSRYYPTTIGDTTAGTKAISTVPFLIGSPILFYSSTTSVAENGLTAYSAIYSGITTSTTTYAWNQNSGWRANEDVYLKGTVSGAMFILDNSTLTSHMTQDLPTTEDGFFYMRIGMMTNTTTGFRLSLQHPIYYHANGELQCLNTANGVAWEDVINKPSTFEPSSHTHTMSQITDLGNIASINTNASTSNYLRGDGTWVTPPNTTYSNATTSTSGLMSNADKSKLDGIATGANNYTHPATHPASMITGLPTSLPANGGHSKTSDGIIGSDTRSFDYEPSVYMSGGSRYLGRAGWQTEFKSCETIGVTSFISGTYCYLETKNPWSDSSGGYPIQIAYGNGTPCYRVGVSTSAWSSWSSYIPSDIKSKIDGIEANANNYTHPANHPPSIITQDANNRFVTDAEKATWNSKGSSNLALGTTSTTAYRGDYGNTAYTHSQSAHAPSNAQANQTLTSGNGMATWTATSGDLTITLGTPSTITNSTTNSVTATSHTHALTLTKADITALGIPAQDTVYTHPATHPPSIIAQDASNRFVTDAEKSSWNAKSDITLGTVQPTVGWWYQVIG